MGMPDPSGEPLREAQQRIEWVLAHPGASQWLKGALRTAHGQDPVRLLNDLELLCVLLKSKSQAIINRELGDP